MMIYMICGNMWKSMSMITHGIPMVHFLLREHGQSASFPPRLAPAQRATLAASAGETQASSAIVTAAEVPAWQPGQPGTLWFNGI